MVNSNFENLTLVLPRNVNPRLSTLLSSLHGRHLSSDNPMVKLIGRHLVSLWDVVPEMNFSQAAGAVHGSLGMMLGWLANDPDQLEGGDRNVSMALGRAIRYHIDSNLSETMSVEQLAATFKVSRSQIYRIFAEDGGVSRYTWERRLQRALRMLSQPAYNKLSIGAVGYECGFSNDSHFSRAFKDRFGTTPRNVRAEAQDAWLSDKASSESREAHRPSGGLDPQSLRQYAPVNRAPR
jgi:AraC-like DNA-binding protein